MEPKQTIKLGYIVRKGRESIREMLSWYNWENIPKTQAEHEDDVIQAKENMRCRKVRVFEVRLVEVVKKPAGKKRQRT